MLLFCCYFQQSEKKKHVKSIVQIWTNWTIHSTYFCLIDMSTMRFRYMKRICCLTLEGWTKNWTNKNRNNFFTSFSCPCRCECDKQQMFFTCTFWNWLRRYVTLKRVMTLFICLFVYGLCLDHWQVHISICKYITWRFVTKPSLSAVKLRVNVKCTQMAYLSLMFNIVVNFLFDWIVNESKDTSHTERHISRFLSGLLSSSCLMHIYINRIECNV